MLGACSSVDGGSTTAVTPEGAVTLNTTSDPALANTLQAQAAATAVSVAELTPRSTATDEPLPTLVVIAEGGAPLSAMTGECPVPEGFSLHVRQGFCLAAPEAWDARNVDGGLAASLGTTPGQALALQPDGTDGSEVCQLMIYVMSGESPEVHLQSRYDVFSQRADIAELSPVAVRSLANLALPGFTWLSTNGAAGGVYADTISISRLLHISFSGTQCGADLLAPALETLRINPET